MKRSPPVLGVVAALPLEARCLGARHARAGGEFWLGEAVVLRVSGMGPLRAGAAAEALVHRGVGALASWGFAGALDPVLRPGALVLPDRVRDTHGGCHAADAAWLEQLRGVAGAALPATGGTLLTHPAVIRDPGEKHRLWRAFGAVAVDMESAAVAAVAGRRGLPFVAARGISDPAAAQLPVAAPAAVGIDGRLRPARCLGHLARHPLELPSLLRLAAATRRAQHTLRLLAAAAGPRLLMPTQPARAGPTRVSAGPRVAHH